MIRQITGRVSYTDLTTVIVDVNGIGYQIHVTIPTTNLRIGEEISFHTYLAVRENALDLYGFLDRDTLGVFELLLTLPKIGPKSALQILSQADISLLKQAVVQGDASYLSKMSGIGKKSAEKIVSGLKDKFDEYETGHDGAVTSDGDTSLSYARDTVDALIALGYSQDDARNAVRKIGAENPEITQSTDALKLALRNLSS